MILGHWKGRLIGGISLAKDTLIKKQTYRRDKSGKGRLIDGISMTGKILGTMTRTTWMKNLVDTWTLEGQTYRWDKSGRR